MSYNIDTWETKRLENLIIPLDSFFKHQRTDWHPTNEIDGSGRIVLNMLDSQIKGRIEHGLLFVDEINISGEGSGTSMDWIVEPALKNSSGLLLASCVWERGDTINQISVVNGDVRWKNIEI